MKKRDLITLRTVPLRISAGKLEIREHEIGFKCMVDNKLIECTISHQVLLDLAGAYGLSHEASALVPTIDGSRVVIQEVHERHL
jgi:predicted house-cleaning NTP pyrophosphatase (Maf/HAM1 superfamily)